MGRDQERLRRVTALRTRPEVVEDLSPSLIEYVCRPERVLGTLHIQLFSHGNSRWYSVACEDELSASRGSHLCEPAPASLTGGDDVVRLHRSRGDFDINRRRKGWVFHFETETAAAQFISLRNGSNEAHLARLV